MTQRSADEPRIGRARPAPSPERLEILACLAKWPSTPLRPVKIARLTGLDGQQVNNLLRSLQSSGQVERVQGGGWRLVQEEQATGTTEAEQAR